MLFSYQIKAARAILGISQLQLGKLAGLHFKTIHNLENSDKRIKKASLETIEKIKNGLDKKGIKFLFPEEGVGGIIFSPPPQIEKKQSTKASKK